MADYAALQGKKNELIRKGLEGSVFKGASTVTAVTKTNLFGTGGAIQALPAGYGDIGWCTTDGPQFSKSVTQDEINSWGAQEPTRIDITSNTTTLKTVMQETNIQSLELYTGADLSAIAPPASGAVEIQEPSKPSPRTYRLLSIAVDVNDAGEIYVCRFMPQAKVSSLGDQSFAGNISYDVTFTGEKDDTLGYAHSWIFGGPGWLDILTDMGFDAAAA